MASSRVVGVNAVQNAIIRELRLYSNYVNDQIDIDVKEVATQLVEDLKVTSPKKTGAYAASWTKTKFKKGWIVHNKNHYQLTHLLERPYALRNGGLSTPKPHIKLAEERAIRTLIERIERTVQGN